MSGDNTQIEWQTLKLDWYRKFNKFYVSSLLNPTFKKERTRTWRKQPTMYSRKLEEIFELNEWL